jgi:hypothetical protein
MEPIIEKMSKLKRATSPRVLNGEQFSRSHLPINFGMRYEGETRDRDVLSTAAVAHNWYWTKPLRGMQRFSPIKPMTSS